MINPNNTILPFLVELQRNNNKVWFDQNRSWYQAATAEFTQFVTDIIEIVATNDPALATATAKNSIYRIFRDVRFSADKTPYKGHLAANIAPNGKKSQYCGFYIQLEPNNQSFFGGGLWIEDKNILQAVRKEICSVPEDFVQILNNPQFQQTFPDGLWTYNKLKKVPNGFDPNFEYADLLKYKHFVVTQFVDDNSLSSTNLYERIANIHKQIIPLNNLFNYIIDDFEQKL